MACRLLTVALHCTFIALPSALWAATPLGSLPRGRTAAHRGRQGQAAVHDVLPRKQWAGNCLLTSLPRMDTGSQPLTASCRLEAAKELKELSLRAPLVHGQAGTQISTHSLYPSCSLEGGLSLTCHLLLPRRRPLSLAISFSLSACCSQALQVCVRSPLQAACNGAP